MGERRWDAAWQWAPITTGCGGEPYLYDQPASVPLSVYRALATLLLVDVSSSIIGEDLGGGLRVLEEVVDHIEVLPRHGIVSIGLG